MNCSTKTVDKEDEMYSRAILFACSRLSLMTCGISFSSICPFLLISVKCVCFFDVRAVLDLCCCMFNKWTDSILFGEL